VIWKAQKKTRARAASGVFLAGFLVNLAMLDDAKMTVDNKEYISSKYS
jgi:hypothetical protein